MKIRELTLLLVLLVIFASAQGQANRISLIINSFNYQTEHASSQDTLQTEKETNLSVLPSIGYYRTLKSNTGIGCEIGFMHSTTKSTITSKTLDNSYNEIQDRISPYNIFYICPTLFQNYYFSNFQFVTSLIFPIEYVTKHEFEFTRDIDILTNGTNIIDYSKTIEPNNIKFGVYCNFNLNMNIYRKVYLGAQTAIGIDTDMRFGQRTNYKSVTENGVVTTEETAITNFRRDSRGRLKFRPGIVLSYNF